MLEEAKRSATQFSSLEEVSDRLWHAPLPVGVGGRWLSFRHSDPARAKHVAAARPGREQAA